MFAQLLSLVALSVLFTPVPTLAVPGPAWIRRQSDAQSSLTLDPAEISAGLEQDGQGDNPDPGQVRSLTSSNNFINFCLPFLDQGVVLTNGAQVTAGSCNQVPMGRIISLDLAPRCKFVFPKNGDESIVENTPFTVQMKILNMETGNFVNAQTNYYAAPQQVNDQGLVIGHSHIVIEAIPDLQTTEPLDPNSFAFFKGLNDPVDGNNILSTAVTAGLPAGVYRMCSINTAANHQPALVSNAQHGALDDCSYFTVKAAGANTAATATESATGSAAETNAATNTAADAAASTTATATDAAQATDAATDSATATDAAATDAAATDAPATDAPAATDAATDVPAATDSATDAGNNANDATDAPAATATDSAAPAATDSPAASDNGNNGDGGDNNNNNGGNNDNNNGGNNNGGNNDNSGNNNGGNGDNSGNGGNNDNNNNNGGDAANNDNSNGGDSSAAPAATDSAAPADDNASATPSQDAPTDSPSAPEATSTQGPSDNNGGDANDNQGGNDSSDNAAAPTTA